MEFRIRLANEATDPGVVLDALQAIDPAAIVDRDPRDGRLRATVWMSADELAATLLIAGISVRSVEQQPSNCCGDCSG